MKKKNRQEINFAPYHDYKSKSAKRKKGLPTIRCACGSRILLVPDLRAMNRAIQNHVAEHKQADYGCAPESIENLLTEQILIAAGKTDLLNMN